MTTSITVVMCVAAVAAAAFVVVYWVGARWWTNRVGRGLMGQGAGIAVILGYAAQRRVVMHPTGPQDGAAVASLVIYAVIALMELNLVWSFWRELRAWRRTRRGRT